jgi:hypothetical protein
MCDSCWKQNMPGCIEKQSRCSEFRKMQFDMTQEVYKKATAKARAQSCPCNTKSKLDNS